MGAVTLTQFQERQIREARQRGAGYRAIASVVGLDRDTVRNYCKRHGLDSGTPTISIPSRELICPSCGQVIRQHPTGRPKKFCSDKCRRAWWSSHPDAIMRSETAQYSKVCKCCGKAFIAYGNANRKYCSRSCYFGDRFGSANDNSLIN